MSRTLRVGARGSRLSLWQARHAVGLMTQLGRATDLRGADAIITYFAVDAAHALKGSDDGPR